MGWHKMTGQSVNIKAWSSVTLSLSSLQTTVDILQVSFIGTEERSRCREVADCGEVTVSRGGFFFLRQQLLIQLFCLCKTCE